MRSWKPVGWALGVVLAIAAALYIWQARSWLHKPVEGLVDSDPVIYEVPRGAVLGGVLKDLQHRGLIAYPRELVTWVRFMRPRYSLKAGEYELRSGMTPVDIVDLFHSGKVLLHQITIVEGRTVKELRVLLKNDPNIVATSSEVADSDLMARLGARPMHPEGWFFPDTYSYAKGTTDIELLRMAHDRMVRELDAAWAERDPALPLADAYEALILASIVEKETGVAAERPRIAGVFISRLRKGMRLETDPTLIYGMGDAYDGDIRTADLHRDQPYNTRTRAGLPPTPICLPSAGSLTAVVHPDVTGDLFFMASSKRDGSHVFSKTYAEHQAAVREYLRTRRR